MSAKLPALKSYWLKGDKVYRVESVSSGTDEVILNDLESDKLYKERYATFKYAYKQVFKIGTVASWLNRTPRSIYRYEVKGILEKQKTYPTVGGKMIRFYTLEDVEHMHELVSQVHQGRRNKNGKVINNSVPDIGTLKLKLRRYYGKT